MRAQWLVLPLLAAAGCQGILGIPSEGQIGCPSPCMPTVSGRAVRAESTQTPPEALSNVTVRLTSVTPAQSVTTGADGTYAFMDLAEGTALQFDVSIPQTGPDPQGLLDTRFAAGTATTDTVVDVPVVQFRWLAQVAVDCGIFPTLNDALFEPGTSNVNSYFVTRTTIVGQVLEENGSPAALDRADITVVINNYLNYQANPSDTTNPPAATICFLEPNVGMGVYQGSNEDHSTSGRFVMFRARNDIGAGTGMGEVRIPGFPKGSLNVASASIGFVRIKLGDGEPLPARPRTFERDVYHYFADKACTTCHKPGAVGVTDSPVRMGYSADWSGTVQNVFDALTVPDMTGCDGATPARVCKVKPDASLLYVNPAGLGTHPGIVLPSDDPMLAAVLAWITDGATLR